jgi:hypothetical protein
MTEVVVTHDFVRVFERCVDVNGVWKGRHECDDLWIVFHKQGGLRSMSVFTPSCALIE